MRGYRSAADYYDNYLFGRSPAEVARKDREDSRRRAEEREATYQDMVRHQDKYGD